MKTYGTINDHVTIDDHVLIIEKNLKIRGSSLKKILTAKYINSEEDGVELTLEDGSSFVIPTFLCSYAYTDAFKQFVLNCGLIEKFTIEKKDLYKYFECVSKSDLDDTSKFDIYRIIKLNQNLKTCMEARQI